MVRWFQRFSADDEREIRTFMQRLSLSTRSRPTAAADLRLLWLKSQLVKRWEAERAVHTPLDAVDWLQLAGGFATAGALIAWSFPNLLRLILSV